ncbi:DUF5987 family protein [Actinoplanes sp. G11-F43]|uniref:DUF5987 family protein n=1 Tax=Actinoplanes sp. G11-F43 TaxID=3424130 RepID=UPI003D3300B5
MTLEAFADTIVPGEKRHAGDRAVAGADSGGGAVAAGALDLLRDPATGLAPTLDSLVITLNEHAGRYATEHGLEPPDDVPPFVGLSFPDRTALVAELTAPEHPEKAMWVGLALFSNMAFDTGAHLATAEAFQQGHPGLLAIGYARPGPDGLWRFPSFSYGRRLADPHPRTTATGSPA